MKIFNNNNMNQKGASLKLIPLGGVGDVTKNMYIYEYGNDILIVDCGVGFPDEAMPGVDLVIPDITYLRDKKEKIRGIIITHGHDDHIGGLPFIWPELQVPIYTRRLTAGFIKNKFTEHGLPKDKIHEVKMEDTLQLGVFKINFYEVSHSVPDTMGIVIETPVGRIIHQADFKIDWTPPSGQVTDVGKIAQIGASGVHFLLMDCLRVEKPGFNKSEKSIEATFEKASWETPGKLLITMTSSNVSRMQQAINVAIKTDRKIALAGRSFDSNFQVARDLGYLKVPPGLVVASDSITGFADRKMLILIAGSQGQPGSALSRVANGEHKQVKIKEGDSVLFSADPIPSTESAQSALIDNLTKLNINVYYSAITSDLHVSGHAAADELKLMINLIKPKYMLPIGGTFRHMRAFSKMAIEMGYEKDKILDVEDGDVLQIDKESIKRVDRLEVRNVYVDGLGVGDIGTVVLRDRQVMSEEGVVIVVIPINQQSGRVEGEPDIISRGFVFEQTAEGLLDEAKQVVKKSLTEHGQKISDWRFMRRMIEDDLEQFLYHATERRPLILPIVVEV
ncbi:MAG: ribonuclease J [Candidatus Daviesbacteria bacterium]|nr:ribonuclease J [Candidatus Daviesbacteria bacterium]